MAGADTKPKDFMRINPDEFAKKPHDGSAMRRRVPRRAIDCKIGLLAEGKYLIAHGYELGEGGLLISSPTPLRKGQKIVVTIRMPGIVHSVMLSQVVYVLESDKKNGITKYGIQFDQIEFDTKRKIRNFVASSVGGSAGSIV